MGVVEHRLIINHAWLENVNESSKILENNFVCFYLLICHKKDFARITEYSFNKLADKPYFYSPRVVCVWLLYVVELPLYFYIDLHHLLTWQVLRHTLNWKPDILSIFSLKHFYGLKAMLSCVKMSWRENGQKIFAEEVIAYYRGYRPGKRSRQFQEIHTISAEKFE